MPETYISPNETCGATDSESITLAIRRAKECGCNRVRIPRYNKRTDSELWMIESTVYLPDDIEIVLEGAHLRLADGVFCNMFANVNVGTPLGRTAAGEQSNITLRGESGAVLDGGEYNGLSERNCSKDGRPHISVNTTLLFVNVRGLTVENLSIINQRYWGITNIFVRDSVFRNISFRADLSRIDAEGVHHPDELPKSYEEIYVKNADGVDLRVGCHNILIENITGFTEDDTVALTALGGFEAELGYMVEGGDADIHDVKIRNVAADPFVCAVVRLLNDNGYKLYNIEVVNITHVCPKDRTMRAGRCICIGDMKYASVHSSFGDTHHIVIRNVVSRAAYAVTLSKGLADSCIENLVVTEDGKYGFGGVRGAHAVLGGCTVRNITTCAPGALAVDEGSFERRKRRGSFAKTSSNGTPFSRC